MKKILLSILFLVLAGSLLAQPQYYNYQNVGTSNNNYPFNVTGGKAVNWLFLAGDFNQPTPCPPGMEITKVYFFTTITSTSTFTNLHILMGQDNSTTLTSGQFWSGTWDTVYYNASVPLTSTANGWMSITLDTPYPYDPTKSLALFVGQCGESPGTIRVRQNSISNIRRVWSVGGCPFTPYSGGDASTVNFGVDVQPAVPTCNYVAGTWCPAGTLPDLPSASIYAAAAWLGDTLYFHAPNNGLSSTTVRKYTWGGTWSLGTPLPLARTYGAMVECNGKIYFIGGGTSSSGGNKTYEYDAGTGAWTTKANLPINRAGHGLVNWGDSVIFVVGGPWSSTPSTGRHVYYYRPAADTWGTLTNSLPSAATRRAFSIGLIENKIIIAAGYQSGGSGFLKSTYIGTIGSNATQLTWAAGPNVPTTCTGLSRSGGTAYGDLFFCVGGECGGPGGSTNTTYVYSLSLNSWFTTIAPMPHAFHNISNQVVPICVNDTARIMIVGGYSSPSYTKFVDVTGCGPVITHFKTITQAPKEYNLSQNYPNPFNPTTKISYTIQKTGLVTLKIYDILGKEIATLVNEVKNTGSYIVEFNGSNLSSGTYFYRMQAGDFISIKKMMFIK